MVPIVFYNGLEKWTAVKSLREYQNSGEIFGNHILNLEYYLIDLSEIEEEYILSTNTVLDNIMYCDRFRKRLELMSAVRRAYGRVKKLGAQEREEFRNWVNNILLSMCGGKESVAEEILNLALTEDGEDEMAFQYNIIRIFEEEKEAKKAEGKAEDILDLLKDFCSVPQDLKNQIFAQKDLNILKQWHKLAARAESIEEFERKMKEGNAL